MAGPATAGDTEIGALRKFTEQRRAGSVSIRHFTVKRGYPPLPPRQVAGHQGQSHQIAPEFGLLQADPT